ncbi:RpiB/LacA/LacB family sugar-phosphate isomerase [Candidatus Calescamantes bacterium]|nr:RpiB/LacA/LacB family sugar-phosphate isomerase [Candidatus Calescamantes bacterium]
MKIAVINETSAADKNKDILAALEGRGHTIINAGMTKTGTQPELTYIHTGLLAAILINLKRVDFVVGGCGTGQGFLNSVMQYPNVCCGLIQTPLDAWLFGQINGGNCISLALNYGYGWAGDINLKFIFDRLFSLKKFGDGYPPHRKQSQRQSIRILRRISKIVHRSFAEIISSLDESIIRPVLTYPGVLELIDIDSIQDNEIKEALKDRI